MRESVLNGGQKRFLKRLRKVDSAGNGAVVQPCGDCQRLFDRARVFVWIDVAGDIRGETIVGRGDCSKVARRGKIVARFQHGQQVTGERLLCVLKRYYNTCDTYSQEKTQTEGEKREKLRAKDGRGAAAAGADA